MQCLILAGGLGTRMKSVGGGTPKALLPAGKETFIDWQLQWLKHLGINNVVLALAHEGKLIEDHIEKEKIKREKLKSDFPSEATQFPEISYSYDGPKLLGTGGAIKNAQNLLESDFMVLYGDSFLFIRLKDFQKIHFEGGKPLTMSIFKNSDQGDSSNVIYKDEELLKYDKIHKTKDMEYIDYGLSYVNRDYFLKHTPEGAFDFATFLSSMVKEKKVTPYVAKLMFHEIGSPKGYERFQRLLLKENFNLKNLNRLMK